MHEIAAGFEKPTLSELNEFAYRWADDNVLDPDWIWIIPLDNGEKNLGYAVITASLLPEYEFNLIEVFRSSEEAESFVKNYWYLED